MEDKILQLYPEPARQVPLKGLYLGENLRSQSEKLARPYVYTNFIQSLDARIAIPHPSGTGMVVPDQIANARDWRLFQELAVQADIIITSGRYFRDYAEGKAQEILRVHEDPEFEDLRLWREAQGLQPYPHLVVISGSLNFPLPDVLMSDDRSIVVATTKNADPERMRKMEAKEGCDLIFAGEEKVAGKALVEGLAELGYRTVYNSTGPKVHHLLLQDHMLDRLYLTNAHRVLGGSPFSSIVEGPLFDAPVNFKLRMVCFDSSALEGIGQLITSYERM
jgi:riboflavin biosynthesis pyrimidine reductase